MNSKDAELLRRIVSGEITSQLDASLNIEEREQIDEFGNLGYLRLFLGGEFEVQSSAYSALEEYDQALLEAQNQARERAQQIAADDAEKQRIARERKMDIRRDYVLFVLGILLGWLLGVITPQNAFNWLTSLFH